ncbi:MAG: hypothetical protein EOM10_06250, partial [Opitutae bacterium]|nr:hypothetical protein [Opitutae bacterium]
MSTFGAALPVSARPRSTASPTRARRVLPRLPLNGGRFLLELLGFKRVNHGLFVRLAWGGGRLFLRHSLGGWGWAAAAAAEAASPELRRDWYFRESLAAIRDWEAILDRWERETPAAARTR